MAIRWFRCVDVIYVHNRVMYNFFNENEEKMNFIALFI